MITQFNMFCAKISQNTVFSPWKERNRGYLLPMSDTHVLYNDTCPICSREIRHYDKLARAADLPLTFDGLQDHAERWGIDPDAAAQRLHVKRGETILTGFDAFVAIWEDIPRYRWLARLATLPVLRHIIAALYDHVAAPLLYRLHVRRQRKNRS